MSPVRSPLRLTSNRPPPWTLAARVLLISSVFASAGPWTSRSVTAAPPDDDSAASPARGVEKDSGNTDAAGAQRAKFPPIFYLRDGSKVTGFPTFEFLVVRTKYGILRIPSTDLLRLRLIPRINSDLEGKIRTQLQRLGSDNFDEREDAMDRLREIGAPALANIRKAVKSRDEEMRNRAEILAEEIESNLEESEKARTDEMSATTGEDDEIIARRFKIKGHVESETFTVKTRYGELQFKVADIVGVDFRVGGKIEQSLSIAANRTAPNNWLSTKSTVTKGQKLTIKASGNLHVSNYSLTVGPGGTTRYGGTTLGNFPMLSLVGQIGKRGKPFLVGPSFKTKANATGTLFLGVVPFRRNYTATGLYKVKVSTD